MKSFIFLALLTGCVLQAQDSAQVSSSSLRDGESTARPLTWREGSAIIQTARRNSGQIDPEEDCSHLVHDIYEMAGLHYSYVPSNDLYRGVDAFERVHAPQPGDLIVWRGHVGVVVNPNEHSFYSSLSTGPKVDAYDSPVWRRRGPARFFRYLLHPGERVRSAPTAVMAAVEEPGSSESEPVPDTPKSSKATQSAAALRPENTEIVLLSRTRATKSEFQEAVVRLWSTASDERQDRWEQTTDVVIVESIKIERLHLQGNAGWVDARIKSAGHLTADAANARALNQNVRLHLVRTKNGWRIDDSSGRMYLSGNAAVIAVSDRLSGIARENASRNEELQTANLLRAILR